jgi:cell division protein FtsB
MNEILSSCWMPGGFEWIVIFAVFFMVFVAPAVVGIGLLIVYLVRNDKEKQRLRAEVKKLTEEVNQLKDKMQR